MNGIEIHFKAGLFSFVDHCPLIELNSVFWTHHYTSTNKTYIRHYFSTYNCMLLKLPPDCCSPSSTGRLGPSVTVAPKGFYPVILSAGPRAKCFTWTVSRAWCVTNSCPPERNCTSWTNSSLFVRRTIRITMEKTQSSWQVINAIKKVV